MRKPIVLAAIIFISVVLVLAYFLYFSHSPNLGKSNGDSVSSEDNSGGVGNFANSSIPCDEVKDVSLRDDCYNEKSVANNDSLGCDKIKDKSLREDCYAGVAENTGSGGAGGAGGKQESGGTGGGPKADNSTLTIEVISAYQCGQNICIQLEAMGNSTKSLNIEGTRYYFNGQEVQAIGWDGNVHGSSCQSTPELEALQSCFGKILNTACINGDIFRAALTDGTFSTRELSECI